MHKHPGPQGRPSHSPGLKQLVLLPQHPQLQLNTRDFGPVLTQLIANLASQKAQSEGLIDFLAGHTDSRLTIIVGNLK